MALNERLRDRILDDLSGQFAQDRLGMEEYEQRVKAVSSARDDHELIKINADILPAHRYLVDTGLQSSPGNGIQAGPGRVMVNYGEAPKHDDAVAIFSGCDRRGQFLAPRKIDAVAIFGGCNIDLRQAAIPADGMELEVAAIFGGCTIILPEGVNAEIQGVGIFGGFNKPQAHFDSTGPRVRINGAAIFGGVEIRIQP
jgi:hypothetical protein